MHSKELITAWEAQDRTRRRLAEAIASDDAEAIEAARTAQAEAIAVIYRLTAKTR